MAKTTKRTGTLSSLCARAGATGTLIPAKAAAASIGRAVEVSARRIEAIAIHDRPAVRDVTVVVVVNSAAVAPVVPPVVPTPAEASKKSNPKAQPKSDSWAIQEKSRIRIPTGKDGQRIPVH